MVYDLAVMCALAWGERSPSRVRVKVRVRFRVKVRQGYKGSGHFLGPCLFLLIWGLLVAGARLGKYTATSVKER